MEKMEKKLNPENRANGKKIQKRKIIAVISLLIIITFLCIFLYSNLLDAFSLFEKREVLAIVTVTDDVGLAVNGTALVFGHVFPGGSASKTIEVTNNYNGMSRVKIYSKGNIKDFLIVSDNNFILAPNETKSVKFRIKIPKETPYGNYSGKVIFEIRNAVVN